MAITYQSSQSATGSSSVVITKPVSTVVGDLLIAVINTQNTISSAPSGWTKLTNKTDSVGSNIYLYYVIATSTEVSATDFTWSASSNHMAGGILRITGDFHSSPFDIYSSDDDVSTTTPTYTETITPQTPDSLLLLCVGSGISTGTTSGVTASGYAITTSNPTWTESFDVTHFTGSSGDSQCSVAYATRPQITATGNATVTLSAARTSASILLAIRPSFVHTQLDTLTLTDSHQKIITKTHSDTVTHTDSTQKTKGRLWRKRSKPSTTWTNRQK